MDSIEMDDTTGTLTIDGTDSANAITVNAASGGGICTYFGTVMTVEDCTIAGNTGDVGSGVISDGPAVIADSTVDDNLSPDSGTGVAAFGDPDTDLTVIHGSIVSDNQAGPDSTLGGDLSGNLGLVNDLIGDTFLGDDVVLIPYSDYAGEALIWGTSADLAPLGNYGGPTQTMPPLPGSPAIGAFEDIDGLYRTSADQRGFAMGDDVGAVQTQAAQPTGLSASAVSASEINLAWTNHNLAGASSEDILVSQDGTNYSYFASVPPTQNYFDVTGWTAGQPTISRSRETTTATCPRRRRYRRPPADRRPRTVSPRRRFRQPRST